MLSDEPFDTHQHEHDSPGTIRNHDRGDANYDVDKAVRIRGDADCDPPEEAVFRRAVGRRRRPTSGPGDQGMSGLPT
jgi:hypothetical protein